jgi:hypothetical protein
MVIEMQIEGEIVGEGEGDGEGEGEGEISKISSWPGSREGITSFVMSFSSAASLSIVSLWLSLATHKSPSTSSIVFRSFSTYACSAASG